MFKRTVCAFSYAALISLTLSQATLAQDAQTETTQDPMAEALAALDAQLPGTLINNPYDIQWKSFGSDKRESVVKSEGVPGGMAYRVVVKKTKPKSWDTAIRIPMTTAIEKDDVILLSFWARAAKVAKGRDTGTMLVSIQRNVDPYDEIFQKDIHPGSEWKLYNIAGKANRNYSADKTNLNFNLARAKQTLEFGQFYIMNLGKDADPEKYMTD